MSKLPENLGGSINLVSAAEIDPDVRDSAVWISLQFDYSKGTGAWDPKVWRELESPTDPQNPQDLFIVETQTGKTRLVPHLGASGIQGLFAS